MRRDLGAVALGFAAGFAGGLFGVGGGVVVVPGLVLWMGISQHAAHATSLAAIVASAGAAAVNFALDGQVDLVRAAVLFLGAASAAYLGARLMTRIPAVWLARAFVVFAAATALRLGLAA